MSDTSNAGSMRAVVYDRYGGPDVLSVRDVERPIMGDDELLVRVQAAEACKSDCEMRSFDFSVKWFWLPLRLGLGVVRPRRRILGLYFAGTIEAIGPDVEGFEVGESVYGSPGLRRGAYGEYLVVSGRAAIAPKPPSMTFAEAASVPLGGHNALHFLRAAGVGEGDHVLINGAGGVIGAHAVQIATAWGATVTAVDAAHKERFVRRMGATHFVDYQRQDVTKLDDRFDVIFDMVPSTSVPRMLDRLVPGGRYANGNPRLTTLLRAPVTSRFGDKRIHVAFADETRAGLRELTTMVEDGAIDSIVDRVLPMNEAAEAHRLVDTEERIGAVVLAMGPRAMER